MGVWLVFDSGAFVSSLTTDARPVVLRAAERWLSERAIHTYNPSSKQKEFHAAGSSYDERMFMAGNQLGKTLALAIEIAAHMTGEYPEWWDDVGGYRFDYPPKTWLLSGSYELFRDGLQTVLLGPPDDRSAWGTGTIPRASLVKTINKQGVSGAVESITVRHKNGRLSTAKIKSYEQGREKVQAATLDLVGCDEEPPADFYSEVMTRLNNGRRGEGGMMAIVFTPLLGMSKVVTRFLEEKPAGSTVIKMGIADVDHYTDKRKSEIIAKYPAHERAARANGDPILGSGLIFPIEQSTIIIDPITIPDHWAHIAGLDLGGAGDDGHPTAGVKIAWDRDSDVMYITNEYAQQGGVTAIHAAALKQWGDWVPFAWPHDGLIKDRHSGDEYALSFRKHGINMLPERATFIDGGNGVEAGIDDMLERMMTGRLKVFSHCQGFLKEMTMYHRKDGIIVKLNDDRISAARYAIMMKRFAIKKPKSAGAWVPKAKWA